MGLIQQIRLLVDREQFEREMADAGKRGGRRLSGGIEESESRLLGFAKKVAVAFGVAFGLRQIVDFGRASVKAAAEAEVAFAKFRSSVEKVGLTMRQVEKDVRRLQDFGNLKTPFGDEATLEAMSRLIDLTQNYELSLSALPVVVDFAVARNIDLASAADVVAKALTGNSTALKKLIPDLRDGVGVLAQMEERFGGRAAATMDTFAGKLTILGNVWGDLKEAIGAALIAAGGGTSVFDTLTGAIQGLTQWVTAHGGQIRAFGMDLIGLGRTAVNVTRWFAALGDAVSGFVASVTEAGAGILEQQSRWAAFLRLPVAQTYREWARAARDQAAAIRETIAARNESGGDDPGGAAHAGADRLFMRGMPRVDRPVRTRSGGGGGDSAAREVEAIRREIAQLASAATATAVDDLAQSLGDLIARAEKAGIGADALKELRDQLLAVTEVGEASDGLLAGFDDALVHVDGLRQQLNEITRLIGQEQVASNKLAIGDVKRIAAEDRIVKLKERQLQVQTRLNELTGESAMAPMEDATATTVSNLTKVLDTVGKVAAGALGFAQAMGLANDKTLLLLNNVANIARSLPDALKFLKAGFTGDPSSFISAAGSAVGLLSGIGGAIFGGESPAEKARREEQRRNTLALQKLTDRIGDLTRFTSSGADLSRVQEQLAGQRPRIDRLFNIPGVREVSDELLQSFGLDPDVLRQVAEDAGLTIGEAFSKAELDAIQAALAQTERGEFADTFAGQIQAFQAEVDILDLEDATKQLDVFRRRMATVKDGAGVLNQALAGLDLTTAEGVEAARKALQDLFRQLPNLTDAQLGGLNREEFLQAIQAGLGIVDLAGQQLAAGGAAGTGGFNISREITEVTGGRLVARLDTSNVHLAEISGNVAELVRVMGGTVVRAPSMTETRHQGALAPAVFNITVQATVSGVTTTAQGGQQLGADAAREIMRALGTEYRTRSLALGTSPQTQRAA